MESKPFLFFRRERWDRYKDPKKYDRDRNLSGKKEASLSVCLHIYVVHIRGSFFRSKVANLNVASQKNEIWSLLLVLRTRMEIVYRRYLLMGSELGTETSVGPLVGSSAMSPIFNFRLGRERRFYYEFCVEKLVFLSFRQYLVEIESKYVDFNVHFFARAQCCVRVSASKFQVLIRSGSRDTTCRWFAHFLAGPARTKNKQKTRATSGVLSMEILLFYFFKLLLNIACGLQNLICFVFLRV